MKKRIGKEKREKELVIANKGGLHLLIGLSGGAPARVVKLETYVFSTLSYRNKKNK